MTQGSAPAASGDRKFVTADDALAMLETGELLSPIGNWVWQKDGDIVACSSGWLRIHGFQTTPGNIDELVSVAHADDRGEFHEAFRAALADRGPYRLQYRIVRQDDGAVRTVDACIQRAGGADGAPIRIVGAVHDITESVRLKEQFEEQAALARQVADNIHAAFWIVSPDWNEVRYISSGYERLWGKSCTALIANGREWLESVVEADRPAVIAAIPPPDMLADCAVVEFPDYRIRTADGNLRWVSARAWPVRDGAGRIVQFTGIAEDISARKATETALRASQATNAVVLGALQAERERLSNILKGTNVGTWEWNVQTGETAFDERWAEIVGYTLAELAPVNIDTWLRLVHPDDLSTSNALLERHFAGELSYYDCKCRMRHKDGHWVWVRDRGKLMQRTADNKPVRMFGTHLEITAEVHAERALQRESAKTLALLRNASDGIHILDTQGCIVECSDSFAAMLGYTRAEVIGMHPTQWDAVHTAEECMKLLRQQLEHPSRTEFETRHRCKDGRLIEVEVSGYPITIEGEVLLFNSSRDISARKAAEAALRESEQNFRALFDHMQSGFALHQIVTDHLGCPIDYVFLAANEAFSRLTGLDRHVLVGKRITEVYPEVTSDTTDWVGIYGKVALSGEPARLESYAAGLQRWYDITAYCPKQGQFAVVINDITDRVEAARTIREVGQFNEQVISCAQEGIIVYGPDLRYQLWNPYMQRFTGMSADQVLGRHPLEVFPFLVEGGVMARLERALAGEIPDTVEFPFSVAQTGFSGWASDLMAPLRNTRGEVIGVIGTVRDITELKQAELALREMNENLESRVEERTQKLAIATRQAEAANRAKSSFLANMSHEIRTPMTAIIGMGELMKLEPMTPRQADRLAKMNTAAEHLLGIINDVLDLSKIEAGKLLLEEAELDVVAIAAGIVTMMGDRARDKGLKLRIDCEPLPFAVRGDATRIRQALLNYVTNAIKFSERGCITLRTRIDSEAAACPSVPGKPWAPRICLRFEVEDQGIGIAPEAVSRLFNNFEQADNSMTRQYGGTGLGLAIVRQIAHLMDGTAGVNSVEGVGSTFWFTAWLQSAEPAEDKAAAATGTTARNPSPGDPEPKRRVLVVDDERVNRDVIVAMLETLGLQVDTAVNGNLAVDLATDSDYELILMDLQMPRMDGLEATRRIRRLPRHAETPIVALTGNTRTEVSEECDRAGVSGFIAKPFRMDQLLAAVRHWLALQPPR